MTYLDILGVLDFEIAQIAIQKLHCCKAIRLCTRDLAYSLSKVKTGWWFQPL